MSKFRFAIAVSRFNEEITPGSQELPGASRRCSPPGPSRGGAGGYELPGPPRNWRSGRYDAVICLGAVLRGATSQNEHIARSLVQHLHGISLATRVPVILGVITPDTWAQAVARSRGRLDRGKEAAEAALEMAALRRRLRSR